MASICCSPPESVPAGWLRRSFKRGQQIKDHIVVVLDGLFAVAAGVGTHLQVLHNGQPAEDTAAFRHLGQAHDG